MQEMQPTSLEELKEVERHSKDLYLNVKASVCIYICIYIILKDVQQ